MTPNRSVVRKIALEVATIVFSVLFALGVDQFRQSRNERAVIAKVKETIAAEIKDNGVVVRAAVAYHDSMFAAMQNGSMFRHAADIALPEWNARRGDRNALRTMIAEKLMDAGSGVSSSFAVKKTKAGYALLEMDQEAPVQFVGDTVRLFLPRGIQLRTALIRNTAWETAQATGALIRMPVPLVAAMADLYQMQRTYQNSANDVLQSLYNNTFTLPALQDLMYWEKQLTDRYAKIDRLLSA